MQACNTGSLYCELNRGGEKGYSGEKQEFCTGRRAVGVVFMKALLVAMVGKLKMKKTVACDYQLSPFYCPDLVQRNRCIFPPRCIWWLFCSLILVACGPTHRTFLQTKGRRRELWALFGRCLHSSRQAGEDAGRQADTAISWETNPSGESFPRKRNLCGFLSLCIINLHSSHWKGC